MKRSTILLPVFALAVLAAAAMYVKYDDWVTFPKHREVIKALLKDPDSAQFKGELISSLGWFCGEVNSKNGLGGYAGYEKFISSPTESYLENLGFIGPGQSSDAYLIERVIEQTKVIKERNALKESTGIGEKASQADIEAEATKRLFSKKWSQVCT